MSEKLMIRYHKTRDGHVKMEWPPIEFPSAFILIVRSLASGMHHALVQSHAEGCADASRRRHDDEHVLRRPPGPPGRRDG